MMKRKQMKEVNVVNNYEEGYPLSHVRIKGKPNGIAEVYLDDKLVHSVAGFKIEQNPADKRVPLLTLQIQCDLDLDTGAIPLLPEPWSWFYKPIAENFVDERDIAPTPQREEMSE